MTTSNGAYDPKVMAEALAELRRQPLPGVDATPEDLVSGRADVLGAGLLTPLAVLRASALSGNVAAMAAYCAEVGVELAPHAKTTMSPEVFMRQLEAGAWGLTAATVGQVRAYRAFGVRRVLLANQLVDPAAIAWVAAERARDRGFELCCYVDSVAGVRLLDDALRSYATPRGGRGGRALPVLVEIGWPGGRTGARGVEEALEVARAAAATDTLCVVGAAEFEGVIGHDASPETLGAVRRFARDLRLLGEGLLAQGLPTHGLDGHPGEGPLILSAGGSAYFDAVVDELTGGWPEGAPVTVVLRSGCYVAHDHGTYARTSPFERGTAGPGHLAPALELWAHVLSRPEPGLALLSAGRRDVSFDAGLPVPLLLRRRDGGTEPARGLSMVGLNDQHAFLAIDPAVDPAGVPAVGDLVCLGISHPCTTFDKWRVIPIVDDDDRVVDVAHTFF